MHQTITGLWVPFLFVWVLILVVWWAAVTIDDVVGGIYSVALLFGLFVVVPWGGPGDGRSSSALLGHFPH